MKHQRVLLLDQSVIKEIRVTGEKLDLTDKKVNGV